METLLVVILALPLVGAMFAAVCGVANARMIALGAVLLNLVLTVVAIAPVIREVSERAAPAAGEVQTFRPLHVPGDVGGGKTNWDLVPVSGNSRAAAIQLYLGLDGLNVWLLLLTSFLMVPAVLVSWTAIDKRQNEYYAWLLALQTPMLGVFLAFDLILFYVFFELTLIPMFFLVGIWGGPMRREAARKFFLFTLAGGVITLVGMIGIVAAVLEQTGVLTFSIPQLIELVQGRLNLASADVRSYWLTAETWIFLAIMLGFAVKVPLFPVHTWLPLAHVEAPTAGSVLLAGVLLKLGTFGFLRVLIPLCPDAAVSVGVPLIGTLSAIGIIYGALCAYAQDDIKKLVAYSSVSHLGFVMLGLFALNRAGIAGGLMQMVNHGLSTGGLFLIVGLLYERYHTRMMADYGGMAGRLKLLSALMVFMCLASVGMPGLNGFIGEMLVMAGVVELRTPTLTGTAFAVCIAIGIFLGGWYLMTMLRKVFFGPLHEPHHEGEHVSDLTLRELLIVVPVAVLCLAMGVCPQPVLTASQGDVDVVANIAAKAKARAAEARPVVAER